MEQIAERGLLDSPSPSHDSAPPSTTSTLAASQSHAPPAPLPKDLLEAHMYNFAQPNVDELVKALEEGRANLEKAVSGIDRETVDELRELLTKSMEVGAVVAEWLEKVDIPGLPPPPSLTLPQSTTANESGPTEQLEQQQQQRTAAAE